VLHEPPLGADAPHASYARGHRAGNRAGEHTGDCVRELFRQFRATGDRDLRNQLVLRHRYLAELYARRFTGRGESLADLVQVALLALLKAVERFDPDYGVAFGSFAEPTIVGELRRHFRDATWPVHVSRRGQELHLALSGAREKLAQELGRSPNLTELAAVMGVTVDDVVHAVEAANAYRTDSIDACRALVDGGFASADTRLAVQSALETLSERDRWVLNLRFVEGKTQAEIARHVGISQVHVSRVLRAALTVLRDRLAGGEVR
jgi:RNA polymerase sigma-B factor